MPESASSSGERTRRALVEAALRLFGRHGFAGASTREIAAGAGANVAAIAYHFGGKEGLRRACVAAIAERMGALVTPLQEPAPASPAEAAARLEAIVRRVTQFMATAPEAQPLAAFLLREITGEPGAIIDEIYNALILPHHGWLCRLWGQAVGADPESETVRLSVFAMVGQVIYFRIGRPMVLRRMGWRTIGPEEAARIAEALVAQLHAALAVGKGGQR